MKFRKFASTNIEVSQIGLGGMSLSGAYGDASFDEGVSVLHLCLDLGINFWDAANIYTNGILHTEEIMSRVLVPNRDKIFIATKVGYVMDPGKTSGYEKGGHSKDGRPETLRRETESCLRRLGVDTIDLMYLHRVDPNVPIEESIGALGDLVQEGKIRFLGLSECTPADILRAETAHPISAVESRYSIVHREIEAEVLPLIKRKNITLVPFRCLSAGMLTQDNPVAVALTRFAADKGITISQLAFAWAMAQDENCIPIQGTKRKKYLIENAKAVDLVLTPEDLSEIDRITAEYNDPAKVWD